MNPKPFIIRHSANGILEYIDPESVPYLGYLPQDIVGTDTLQLYRPSDLAYLRQVYEMIVKEGAVHRSKPYRLVICCNKNNFFLNKQFFILSISSKDVDPKWRLFETGNGMVFVY